MVFPEDWQIQLGWGAGWVGLVQVGVFWVHRDLSYSYREGIGKKMKYKQKQYKMKGWKKYLQHFDFLDFIFPNSDVLQSKSDETWSFRINL